MNIAERLSTIDAGQLEQWAGKANQFAPPVVAVILVIAIAYQLAQITWLFFPGEAPDSAPVVSTQPVAASSQFSPAEIGALKDSHPFGKAPEQSAASAVPDVPLEDAPETTLNLTLTGVVARNGDSPAMAIIASGRGEQKTYRVGDEIENASGAQLRSVYADRVILLRGGRLETLTFPDQDSGRTAAARPRRTAGTLAPVASGATPLRTALSDNAQRFTKIMRIAPQVEEGRVIGFRVTPSSDEDAFAALGLQAGDVITEINGITLNDPSRGLEAFQALGESTSANVTLMRDGSPQVLVIDTSKVQSLSQGRQ